MAGARRLPYIVSAYSSRWLIPQSEFETTTSPGCMATAHDRAERSQWSDWSNWLSGRTERRTESISNWPPAVPRAGRPWVRVGPARCLLALRRRRRRSSSSSSNQWDVAVQYVCLSPSADSDEQTNCTDPYCGNCSSQSSRPSAMKLN